MEASTVITSIVGLLIAMIAWLAKDKIKNITDSNKDLYSAVEKVLAKVDKLAEGLNEFKLEVAKSGIDILRNDLKAIQVGLSKVEMSDAKQWETLSKIAKRRTSDSI